MAAAVSPWRDLEAVAGHDAAQLKAVFPEHGDRAVATLVKRIGSLDDDGDGALLVADLPEADDRRPSFGDMQRARFGELEGRLRCPVQHLEAAARGALSGPLLDVQVHV